MASRRKIEALRNLAERPGTEAEGRLAQEILDRLSPSEVEDGFDRILESLSGIPTHFPCACGTMNPLGETCRNQTQHLNIHMQIRVKFKKGDRVYYNQWAYPENAPAVVGWHLKPAKENWSHPWAWIGLRFDHLKNARQVPIYSAKGWHLSHEPLDADTLLKRGLNRP